MNKYVKLIKAIGINVGVFVLICFIVIAICLLIIYPFIPYGNIRYCEIYVSSKCFEKFVNSSNIDNNVCKLTLYFPTIENCTLIAIGPCLHRIYITTLNETICKNYEPIMCKIFYGNCKVSIYQLILYFGKEIPKHELYCKIINVTCKFKHKTTNKTIEIMLKI